MTLPRSVTKCSRSPSCVAITPEKSVVSRGLELAVLVACFTPGPSAQTGEEIAAEARPARSKLAAVVGQCLRGRERRRLRIIRISAAGRDREWLPHSEAGCTCWDLFHCDRAGRRASGRLIPPGPSRPCRAAR